eukprot:86787-Pyramimonas_sp.AAC.1
MDPPFLATPVTPLPVVRGRTLLQVFVRRWWVPIRTRSRGRRGHAAVSAKSWGRIEFSSGPNELGLHERLLSSARRTTDPEEADFFFVPTWGQ